MNPHEDALMNEIQVGTYVAYLLISIPLTVAVGRTLYTHGQAFLVDAFGGDSDLAGSVNHLLVVGFYLINCGWVTRSMSTSEILIHAHEGLEFLASRVGAVLLILGVMHFFNLFVLNRFRRRGLESKAPPPVLPNEYLARKAS